MKFAKEYIAKALTASARCLWVSETMDLGWSFLPTFRFRGSTALAAFCLAWSFLKYSEPRLAIFLPPLRPSSTAAGSFFRGIVSLRRVGLCEDSKAIQHTAWLEHSESLCNLENENLTNELTQSQSSGLSRLRVKSRLVSLLRAKPVQAMLHLCQNCGCVAIFGESQVSTLHSTSD